MKDSCRDDIGLRQKKNMEYERKELKDQTHVGMKIACRCKNIGQQEDVLNEEEMLC